MPRSLLWVLAIVLALQLLTALCAQEGGKPARLDRFDDPLPAGVLARLGTVRFHHSRCAAYSPDGKIIATADGTEVNLWDAATGKKIRRLPLEAEWGAVGLIFSHNGKKLAEIGWGGTSVQVWDLSTFEKVVLEQAKGGGAGGDWSGAAAFSRDDKTLVSATSSTLFQWDVGSGKKLKEFPFQIQNKDVDVRLLAFADDGTVAATRGDKNLFLWDTQTGQCLHDIKVLDGGETLKFSADGKTLAVSGYGHWLNLFSVETGKKIHSLPVARRVESVAFSTDGKRMAAASSATAGSSSTEGDQLIQVWDLGNLAAAPVKFEAPGVDSVIFSPDGKTLAWGCQGQTLCFMDSTTGKDRRPTESHRGAIKSLIYLPDGKRIVSASADGTIRIWDAETGKSLSVLRGHVGDVLGLALFPNGELLASCGKDATFRLWDLEHGKGLAVLNDERNSVVAAAFSADGKQLASGGDRGVIFLRDPATGKILDDIEAHSIASLAFSPDGKTLAALLDHDHKLLLHDLTTKKTMEVAVEGGGSSLAYSPDGKLLSVGCNETMLLLDTATNEVVRKLPGHYNRRGCVVFSPDSRYLASVSDGYGRIANRTLRVFEMATGTEIHSFASELPLFAAAFSPDGLRLVVGGADATAVVLDLTNLTGKQCPETLTENALAAHWESLTATDASEAYESRADLLHAPKSTVPFLAKHLPPAPALNAKRVAALVKQLNSEAFGDREDASKELEQMGELVREPLRKALAADPPAEARRRLKALLARLEQFTPAQLRSLRAVEILEGIGTAEAFELLERLAQGNTDGLLTSQSRAAIARKQKKSAPLPEIPKALDSPVVERPTPGPVRRDLDGDAMPPGALARLGSARWRLADEPRRIIPCKEGKTLAVVNNQSGVELVDADTGRCADRSGTGLFSWGLDLSRSVAVTADGRKVAALAAGEKGQGVLAIGERSGAGKVIIPFMRPKSLDPVIPEEVEASGSHSSGTAQYLSAAEFSPDGKTLIGAVRFEWECSGSKVKKEVKESHVSAWDAATGKERWKSPALEQAINTILYSPDGKTLTVVDRTGIGFWDAAAGRELRRWESKAPLFSASYSPDRSWLATGSKDEVLLWEVATGNVKWRLAIPGEEVKALAFSPDGNTLVGGCERTIRFWDTRTGKAVGDSPDFPNAVEAVAFSRDGKLLFSGHQKENALRRWEVAGRKPFGDRGGPLAPARLLSFSSDSRKILATATGEDFYLWEAETGKPCPLPAKDDERFLTDWLATSGRTALLRCEEGFGVRFAMLLTGKVNRLDQLPGFLGSSVDGQRVLVHSKKDNLPCLAVLKVSGRDFKDKDRQPDAIEREFVWKDGDDVSAALSPDGKTVAAAGNDVVYFFDVSAGGTRRYAHPTDVKPEFFFQTQAVKFSADGSRIALAGGDGQVRIVAVKDGRRLAEIATKSRRLTGLAFSPDGQTLLTTGMNAPVCVWEVATGQLVRRLEPATYLFSPDNRLLAGSTGTLKLFDLYSGRVIRECDGAGIRLGNFAFSPNSQFLAASCADTTLLVWPATATDSRAVKPLDEKSLARALAAEDAAAAYEALGRLIADPEQALPLLKRCLHATPRTDKPPPAPEELLTSLSAEDVLHLRAIQVLERMGTNPARQLLEKLARGADQSPRTRAAAEALERLAAH